MTARNVYFATAITVVALTLSTLAVPATAATPPTWTAPVDVSTASQSGAIPYVAIAPNDTVVSIWQGTTGFTSTIQASVSTDRGVSWSTGVDVSLAGGPAYDPRVVAAADGSFTAFWYRHNGTNLRVQASTSVDNGASWSIPVDISAPGENAFNVQASTGADGTLTATWHRTEGGIGVIQASTSSDQGATWTTPVSISSPGLDSFMAQIAIGLDGTRVITWYGADGNGNNLVQASSSLDQGATWSSPTSLSAAGQDAQAPVIAVAPDGTFTIAWSVFNGVEAVTQTSTSTDHGATWGSAVTISGTGGDAGGPALTAAADGTIIATWRRYDGSSYLVQATSSVDQGVTWGTPTTLSAPGENGNEQQVIAAPDGTITAVWYRLNGSYYVVQASTSIDQGSTWSAPLDLSTPGRTARAPQLTAATDSALTVVWHGEVVGISFVQATSLLIAAAAAPAGASLPATGTDAGPVGVAALLLLLLGGTLLLRRRHPISN